MSRQRNAQFSRTPPAWWVRCAVIALACVHVIAPTWHICPMGATASASSETMVCAHSGVPTPQDKQQLTNVPMEEHCLARLLQHVLANPQFTLALDFSAHTIATVQAENQVLPQSPSLPFNQARAPPSLVI